MPGTQHLPFRHKLLTIAILATLPSSASWALELVQEPPLPTSKSAFVAPNVIISVDDSGSMDWGIKTTSGGTSATGKGYTEPNDDGTWASNAKRINVLKYTLKTVFNNKELIPENKIRIAWQAMNNSDTSVISTDGNIKKNSMRPIDALIPREVELDTGRYVWTLNRRGNVREEDCDPITGIIRTSNSGTLGRCSYVPDKGIVYDKHRDNFLSFIGGLKADGGTPSHKMFSQADAYMRAATDKNGPWSTDPGGTGSKATEYLGCRRNYHIMMTDGVWNSLSDSHKSGDQDGINWEELNDRKAYKTTSDQTKVYYDGHSNMLADWALKSWMDPLQDPKKLIDSANLKPSKIYEDAPTTENFTKTKTITTDVEPCLESENYWTWEGWKKRCIKWTQKTVTETKSVNLEKYWNPKYNPATWPHMVTYTVGFSDQATKWQFSPNITAPTDKVPFGYTDGFVDLVTGWAQWPNLLSSNHHESDSKSDRALDLWHASINGRGRFYAVTEAEDLAKAFTEIIGKINEESAPLPDSIAGGGSTSGYNVSQTNAGIFASVYSPKDGWSGYIKATRAIEPEEYACPTKDDPEKKCFRFPDVISGWKGKSTADRLDELLPVDGHPDGRLVLSWSDKNNAGTAFKWPTAADATIDYSTTQIKALLGITTTADLTADQKTQAKNLVNYIRGDRSLEGTTTNKPLRVRYSRQGDIVNSEIWYTGGPISNYAMGYSSFVKAQKDRTPILYVGGNDGMLHGFSAKDGKEVLAYVPRGVVGNLRNLADKDYKHQYYVDGSPMTGDIKDGETWKTMLVGTLGAGGKGYFLLDVTNPASFDSSNVLLDRTSGNSEAATNCSLLSGAAQTACSTAVEENNDIGNITAQPGRNPANLQETTQITRMNNGRWAVVMGNGYNSANQRPVLLVQYLDGDKALKRIHAVPAEVATGSDNAKDNGLAAPALVDLDGDGKTDIAYAGDNLGNLWKFDLTSTTDANWKVAFGDNKPLFTARGLLKSDSATRDQVQPITAPPVVRASDRSMTVGTGTDAKTIPLAGMMVAFGTGRNLTKEDRRTDITQPVQTLYSVLDNTRYRMNSDKTSLEVHPGSGNCTTAPATCIPTPTPVGTMGATGVALAKQDIDKVDGDFATVKATNELKKETWKDYKGWYLDLPATGERLLKPMQFYDGSNILAVYSETPSGIKNSESDNINESCVPVKVDTSAGSQFRTFINIMDGKLPNIQLVDYNGDGVYDTKDLLVARAAVKTGTPILITKRNRIVDLTGGGGGRDTLARMPENSMRPSWRQLK
ncbi:pilus assembly protein [Comamonas jiangduensis]|uniref:pilus assembly protein n=1 Tax=Comamonas jiangduensis TaxID=1194168 RepID=UPI0024E11CAA|nr:PilC/PilY family type IV pilus protein [Comamonas jiangduensis]